MDLAKTRQAINGYRAYNNAQVTQAEKRAKQEATRNRQASQRREAEIAKATKSFVEFLGSQEYVLGEELLALSGKYIDIAFKGGRQYYVSGQGLRYSEKAVDGPEVVRGSATPAKAMTALVDSGKTFDQWLTEAREQLKEIVAAAPSV